MREGVVRRLLTGAYTHAAGAVVDVAKLVLQTKAAGRSRMGAGGGYPPPWIVFDYLMADAEAADRGRLLDRGGL